MRRISDTLDRLGAMQRAMQAADAVANPDDGRLAPLADFGRNPGALRASTFVPADLPPGAALVVALHGCTQTAAGYDRGTGWSTLAAREGFALLLPEQARSNNPNLCFNWFEPGDIARRGGEAESIAEMVEALVAEHAIDRARIFVTGLSAGGAMAAVMLAAYPDLFAGGAIIGGLPYGCAAGVPQALDRMRGHGLPGDAAATDAVRRAGRSPKAWPTISLWHGTQDSTVAVSNMAAHGRQWRGVHGLSATASAIERGGNWEHRSWNGPDGRTLVEEWSVTGMGHGVPIDPSGPDGLGEAGPYMLDAGIASTREIAAGWGLAERTAARPSPTASHRAPAVALPPLPPIEDAPPSDKPAMAPTDPRGFIEAALRSAGLML